MNAKKVRLFGGIWLGSVLTGCASFNDTVVIDIGDQFELLRLERADTGHGGPVRPRLRGFDCEFSAHSEHGSLFGGRRDIHGTVRCRAVESGNTGAAGG